MIKLTRWGFQHWSPITKTEFWGWKTLVGVHKPGFGVEVAILCEDRQPYTDQSLSALIVAICYEKVQSNSVNLKVGVKVC